MGHPVPAARLTQTGPNGIRFDFNRGARVELPPRAAGKWRIRLRDLDTGNVLFQDECQRGRFNSGKRYFVRFKLEVWDLDESGAARAVWSHDYDARGRDVIIQFPIGTLGDVLAWFPYAARFAREHGCRLVCAMSDLIIPLLRDAYPEIRFVTHEELVEQKLRETAYATYYLGLFFDDAAGIHQPTDFRHVGLHRTAGYILGVDPAEAAPRIALPDESRPIAEPYVVIAVQASSQCKMWNNPHGWRQVIAFVKSRGYRVICIDQKAVGGARLIHTLIPHGSEDETGDRPLTERARWLRHAAAFIGLSSGLAWLAWAAGTPVVLISGFTHPSNEFTTPGRVINFHACNSCWNDPRHRFEHNDFLWCPRHAGTDRQFECTRLITAAHVIRALESVPNFARTPFAGAAPIEIAARAINLARTPARWAAFERTNRGVVPYERFEAIDGTLIDRAEHVAMGTITADLAYSEGALGNAMSHIELWRQVAEGDRALTVCEDDAVFSRGFTEQAARLAASVPDFDIIVWGWNMDAALSVRIQGETPVIMLFSQDQMRASIESFRQPESSVALLRLNVALGLVCYTISPAGARNLLNRCLPLNPLVLSMPITGRKIANIGLDVALSAAYAHVSAFVCFPPLVVTPNDHATSTVQRAAT